MLFLQQFSGGLTPASIARREARQEGGGAEEGRKRKVRKEPQTSWIIKENLILQQTINGGGWMH